MDFIHTDLGNRSRGEIVEVTLNGNAANVRLLDSSNFSSYRAGRNHRYIGGLAKRSPVRLEIPRSGRWHVAVDMQGLRGNTRSSVRVLPSPLPDIRERPLSSEPSLVHGDYTGETAPESSASSREYDVFISHSSADKDEVVRPLANALQSKGLSVWYDEFELRIGDSLRKKIDHGLSRSRFGIVVLSDAFFNSGWPNYELDGIVTRAIGGDQIILPIWHKVSKQEVTSYSPSLADKLARNTATHTVEDIATEIAELIHGS